MKKYLLISVMLLATACMVKQANAQAGRMQDLSLSPDESFKQPTINNHPVEGSYQNDITRRSVSKEHPDGMPAPRPDVTPAKSFMDGYCDPSFVPLLANNRRYFGMEDCLKNQRDDACARFHSLPKEVKIVMDDAISCLFANGNSYSAESTGTTDNDYMACGTSYARRIEMLKKYLSDVYTTYALVYLPDDVLDTQGRCINRK